MVINAVQGLQTTGITMNERFTKLAAAAPAPAPMQQPRQRKRFRLNPYTDFGYSDKLILEQIAMRLQQISHKRLLKRRLGVPRGGLRRYGSEGNLPGLRRSNSFGSLHYNKGRGGWRQSNVNLSRSASFDNLAQGGVRKRTRGFRRRFGGGFRPLRGRSRGNGTNRGGQQMQGPGRGQQRARRGRAAQPGRGQAARGRGRGGMSRSQTRKPVPTKEELDNQLDQYMACSKAALDKELDAYMKNAMQLD